jgi:hypothetical protein
MQLAKQPVQPCSHKKAAPEGRLMIGPWDRGARAPLERSSGSKLWNEELDQAQPFWDMDST